MSTCGGGWRWDEAEAHGGVVAVGSARAGRPAAGAGVEALQHVDERGDTGRRGGFVGGRGHVPRLVWGFVVVHGVFGFLVCGAGVGESLSRGVDGVLVSAGFGLL
ncbi:hypothetical protein [Saccharothrix hoggarensis]|uniref:Uncharacterized protein n=1 Tax=Saccharothrix hoggarensis TaxID=913853 RepID=A0ABW3R063_9PSEU